MENFQIIEDVELSTVDGGGWKAQLAIAAPVILLGPAGAVISLGMAVGYYL